MDHQLVLGYGLVRTERNGMECDFGDIHFGRDREIVDFGNRSIQPQMDKSLNAAV